MNCLWHRVLQYYNLWKKVLSIHQLRITCANMQLILESILKLWVNWNFILRQVLRQLLQISAYPMICQKSKYSLKISKITNFNKIVQLALLAKPYTRPTRWLAELAWPAKLFHWYTAVALPSRVVHSANHVFSRWFWSASMSLRPSVIIG